MRGTHGPPEGGRTLRMRCTHGPPKGGHYVRVRSVRLQPDLGIMSPTSIALVALAAILIMMGAEALVAARNERRLRLRGAVEPPGDVYAAMQWVYPAVFVAMAHSPP